MSVALIKKAELCRVCKKNNLERVFSFGPTPLANAFVKPTDIDKGEMFYPLDVYFCKDCYFLQLGHVVNPEVLFGDYVYVSSTSPVFINHFKMFADDIYSRFKLDKKSLVIDIGSNDGILLKPFLEKGTQVLGIEPASHIARIAIKDGIDTIDEYFNIPLAKKIARKYGKAKIITATNVFAHIDDIDEVVLGLKEMMDDNGVFIIEAPYLIDFLEKRYFDLVYHEHLSYWSIAPLTTFFKRFDMSVFDVQKVSSHGGSIRIFIKKNKGVHKLEKRVAGFLKKEKKKKLNKIQTYRDFADLVLENKVKLIKLLAELKKKNKKIVGYGAPAKGNTLLNYFKIGNDILDYIIDDSPFKQGLYAPGTYIPVVSSKSLKKARPDYVLILAWNFAESIIKNNSDYQSSGGHFIIPVPKPKII